MLLIWDIHMTSKMKDQICDSLEAFVQARPDEQHIVLVGDFVYHFSYDRGALMQLYRLLVKWFQRGKTIYVLAGNHDRLWSHFVFAEAKAAFDLLNQHSTNKLLFITQPEMHTIEGKWVFFLPYMIDVQMPELSDMYESWVHQALKSTIDDLMLSNHAGEQLSGKINAVLLDAVSRHTDELLVIHHYYIAQTVFPGMRSQFSYKDISLSPIVFELEHVRLISGHLHQPFVHHNYLCVGSRRHTSPLEIQQYKIMCQFDLTKDVLSFSYHHINPYVVLSRADIWSWWDASISVADPGLWSMLDGSLFGSVWEQAKSQFSKVWISEISDLLMTLDEQMQDLLHTQASWNIQRRSREVPAFDRMMLTIRTDASVWYVDIDQFVDQDVMTQIRDVKLKKSSVIETESLELKNPWMSLRGRQEVLTTYIRSKYPETFQRYEDVLRSLQIMS